MQFFRTAQARELHEELGKKITQYGNSVGCMSSPDDWFSITGGSGLVDSYSNLQIIREICGECPVKNLCLAYAVEQKEEFGVFGGLTPGERKRIRKAMQK